MRSERRSDGVIAQKSLERKKVSRRAFLSILGGGALLSASGFGANLGYRIAQDDWRPELLSKGQPGALSDKAMRTLLALSETLVAPDWNPGLPRIQVVITTAVHTIPGLREEYEAGAALLDRRSRRRKARRFASLSSSDQVALLESFLWRFEAESGESTVQDVQSKGLRRLERLTHSEGERRFRQLVLRDLLYRIHMDAALQMIGYSNVPGRAGNPRDYVGPPPQAVES